MTTQTLTLNHQTRLAVQIIIEDDTGALTFSILLATRLFVLLYQAGLLISSIGYELSVLTDDFKAALNFAGKVFAIGLNSLAYGFGVTL